MKQNNSICKILALAAFFVAANVTAQTTASVSSKCLNCAPRKVNAKPPVTPPDISLSSHGNADANHEYPSHVVITNTSAIDVDGTRYVKMHNFGYVINYPKRTVALYFLRGVDRRFDYKISNVKFYPLVKDAKRYHEAFYIQDVGECRIYFDGATHDVVGVVLEHWGFPDLSGQRVTHEGLTSNF